MSPEQPRPRQNGGEPVTPAARILFNAMLNEREAKGVEAYGRSLHTDNGRDALQDLAEELIDGWQYLVQARMERATLHAALKRWLVARDAFKVMSKPDSFEVVAATYALEALARETLRE